MENYYFLHPVPVAIQQAIFVDHFEEGVVLIGGVDKQTGRRKDFVHLRSVDAPRFESRRYDLMLEVRRVGRMKTCRNT
jgi:hypothetical protein